jgi:hypothetical protein
MGLTVDKIRALQPQLKRFVASDSNGLNLEVAPSGLKSWRLRFRHVGKPSWFTIGHRPHMSLMSARAKRNEIMLQVRAGISPVEQRRKKLIELEGSVTVRQFGERYLREVVRNNRKNPQGIARSLERDIYPMIGSMPLSHVTPQEFKPSYSRNAIRDISKRPDYYTAFSSACLLTRSSARS